MGSCIFTKIIITELNYTFEFKIKARLLNCRFTSVGNNCRFIIKGNCTII